MKFKVQALMMVVTGLVALGVTSGCQDVMEAPDAACTPGAQQVCPCLGGAPGVQSCREGGDAWGQCSCPDGQTTRPNPTPDPGDPGDPVTGEAAIIGGAQRSSTPPEAVAGGVERCDGVRTPNAADLPWVTQAPDGDWGSNSCCGPAVVTHIWGLHNRRTALGAQDLYNTIDWMDQNIPGRLSNNYSCNYTNDQDLVRMLDEYVGVSASVKTLPWCSLVDYLDGKHAVILLADAQGSNSTQTFKSTGQRENSHWIILESIDGDTVRVNDPGRSRAADGDSRAYTTASVRSSFEAFGSLAIIVDLSPPEEPSDCTNACTRGDRQCASGGVSECVVGAEGCTTWSAPRACSVPGQQCQGRGQCACLPTGRVCQGASVYDTDSCGGASFVQSCAHGCADGVCQQQSCQPRSCASAGAQCGDLSDGCGGTLRCGTCAGGDTCQSGRCVCNPEEVCQLASPAYRSATSAEYDGGGGEVMRLRVTSTSSCDRLRFKLDKTSGSLGPGEYYLRVGTCASYGTIRASKTLTASASSITFETDHRGAPGDTKIFCVTKRDDAAPHAASAHFRSNIAQVELDLSC